MTPALNLGISSEALYCMVGGDMIAKMALQAFNSMVLKRGGNTRGLTSNRVQSSHRSSSVAGTIQSQAWVGKQGRIGQLTKNLHKQAQGCNLSNNLRLRNVMWWPQFLGREQRNPTATPRSHHGPP